MEKEECYRDDSRSNPLLSVVMPVYNPHQYFPICIDSILQQTFRDFELIAIDDASTDKSYAILKEYESKDSRIKSMRNENSLGAARTRNRGLNVASGEYIIFLDADDFFERDFFENMLSAIVSARADVAICGYFWRDELNGTEQLKLQDIKGLNGQLEQSFRPTDFNNAIFYGILYVPFNKVIRRKMLLDKGIEFQDIPNCNDVYFSIITVAEAEYIVYLPKPYIHYRYNTGFQISTNRHKNPLCVCYAFQKVREEFIARGLWNKFSHVYNDTIVTTLLGIARNAVEPEALIDYIHGNGKGKLGISNLKKGDFSSNRIYGMYGILINSERTVLSNMLDTVVCCIKALKNGNIYALYWLLGHYTMAVLRKLRW